MTRGLLSLLVLCVFVSCNEGLVPKKHEMRGAWVASVKNIDWPSKPQHSADGLKKEFRKIASFHHLNGFNALIVQVRPATDAFYPSEYEPWSEWLTGTQGLGPEPMFDPLHYMIEETHDLGMEFHAWFNPYRAVIDSDSAKTALNHITRLRPGWFVKYGDNTYFDPGIPDARNYLVQVIGEVVRNYDLDAIHFDDYFYPYKIAGMEFPDSVSFNKYGRDFSSVEEWRRDNVNRLVKELNEEIKSIKPYMKFGISPFGVWRNDQLDENGSATKAGVTNYDDLYADILLWLRNEWIDYVVPQIYWHIGFDLADYSVLAEWWDKNSYGRHLYIGQASYRIGGNINEAWKNPSEMLDHLRLNDTKESIIGDIYFNTNSLFRNPLGFTDSLRSQRYAYPALVPPMKWIDDEPPSSPRDVSISIDQNGNYLTWDYKGGETPAYFLVYRFKGKKPGNINDARNIVSKIRNPGTEYLDRDLISGYYTYQITSIDRNNNESNPSEPVIIKAKLRK